MKDGKVLLADLINNTGTKKYLKIEKEGSKEASLNDSKIEEHKKWDGIHAIITNHRDNDLTSEQILKRYRDLWQIEAAFRLNKHDLKMRPIYHWTENRIKSHILICFIAYSLASFVKYKLDKLNFKLSFEEIKDELNRVQASIVEDSKTKKRFMLPSKLTEIQKKIYKAFGLKIIQEARILKN
jgi:transposase